MLCHAVHVGLRVRHACRRKNPGLRPQHLAGLRLITEISCGALQGGEVGSSAIVLQPGRLQCKNAIGDTGTAGSCALLTQVIDHPSAHQTLSKWKIWCIPSVWQA